MKLNIFQFRFSKLSVLLFCSSTDITERNKNMLKRIRHKRRSLRKFLRKIQFSNNKRCSKEDV